MAMLFCENHPELRWHCKDIAISENGQYNGARNIFFFGQATKEKPNGESVVDNKWVIECDCPASKLKAIEGTYDPADTIRGF